MDKREIAGIMFDPDLIIDVAKGITSPEQLADRFQLSLAQLDALTEEPKFRSHVENAKNELMHDGAMISGKSNYLIADALIPRILVALDDPTTPVDDLVKLAGVLIKLREPVKMPGLAGSLGGEGVTIVINTNPVRVERTIKVIDAITVASNAEA